jgi:hypothetical protein
MIKALTSGNEALRGWLSNARHSLKVVITIYWTVQYHNTQDSSMNFQALKILDFIEISRNLLTFNRRMGQFFSLRCIFFFIQMGEYFPAVGI